MPNARRQECEFAADEHHQFPAARPRETVRAHAADDDVAEVVVKCHLMAITPYSGHRYQCCQR